MELGIRILIVFGILITFAGCGTLSPADFGADPPKLSPSSGGPVAVQGEHAEPAIWRFNANGLGFEYDRNAFSDELARLVSDSLSSAGVSIGGGDKTIAIRLIYLDFMYQGPCIVDYAVRHGDGEWRGGQTRHDSSNFAIACREALELAAHEIVTSVPTRTYMGGFP